MQGTTYSLLTTQLIFALFSAIRAHPPLSPPREQFERAIASVNETRFVLCPDGNGPLLEGNGNIFQCQNICPEGFNCKRLSYEKTQGICCPNIEELYRLYTDNNFDNHVSKKQTAEHSQIQVVKSNDAEHMEIIEPNAELELLSLARLSAEIRRRRQEKQTVFDKKSNSPILNKLNQERYSCRRQTFQKSCTTNRQRTQFVLRWYYREGACVSYPWGYCPGEPVASDPTLRTEEECQILCVQPIEGIVRELENRLNQSANVLLGQANNIIVNTAQILQPNATLILPSEQKPNLPTTTIQPRTTFSQATVTSSPLQQIKGVASESNSSHGAELKAKELILKTVSIVNKRCERLSPYRALCNDGRQSQFTLRWYLRGSSCELYPFGDCTEVPKSGDFSPITSKKECIAICLNGKN